MAFRGLFIHLAVKASRLTCTSNGGITTISRLTSTSKKSSSIEVPTSTNSQLRKSIKIFIKGIGIILFVAVTDHLAHEKYRAVKKKLERGTKPPICNINNTIDRAKEEEEVKGVILGNQKKCYGIILGPTGTGKSYVVTKVCHEYHSRVIYYHVMAPKSLPLDLASAVDMKLRPRMFDHLVNRYFPGFENHFILPKGFEEALAFVFETINDQAKILKEKTGDVVTLVLDGVDLVAKKSDDDFIAL